MTQEREQLKEKIAQIVHEAAFENGYLHPWADAGRTQFYKKADRILALFDGGKSSGEATKPTNEEKTDGLIGWRRDFLKLPMSERRRLLAQQAQALKDLYNDSDAREWTEATDGGC